jgi:Na+-transporting NADH:ubiquinone oxidoreductase subunit C
MGQKAEGEKGMNEKLRTVIFTIAVTAVFAILVSGVNAALSEKIAANKLIARQKVILELFGLNPQSLPEEQIPGVFAEKIADNPKFGGTAIESFLLKDGNGSLQVCSFSGQGFWDAIKGFIAIDLSEKVVKGIEFTQHGETPGLGGRISEPEFKARFVGKPFAAVRSDGLRLKFVAEGTAGRADEIDGITGATGTTGALEKIINGAISQILEINERGAAK